MFSSLVSHVVNARFIYPRLVSQLAASSNTAASTATTAAATLAAKTAATKAPVKEILPSLGASGAIYAAVTLTALAFPALHVALIIPPSFPIPIQYGVGGMILLDCVGVLRGWRYAFN
jgi:rhomboid-like protein